MASKKKTTKKKTSKKGAAAESSSQAAGPVRTKPYKGTGLQMASPDLHDVRVHSPAYKNPADAMGSKAFTTGKDIFFTDGHYTPGSQGGKSLLGHEAAHVVPQR